MSRKTSSKININLFIVNIINVSVYVLSGNYGVAIIASVTTFRAFLYAFKDKYSTNLVYYLFLTAQLIIGVMSINEMKDILVLIAAVITCTITWFGKPQSIRIGCSVSDILWMTFNLMSGLYIQSLNFFIGFISKIILFLINYKKDKQNLCK